MQGRIPLYNRAIGEEKMRIVKPEIKPISTVDEISHINLDYILLFFCFFPFVGWLPGFDSQPFALICAILTLISKRRIKIKYKRLLILCLVIVVVLAVFSFTEKEVFDVMKRGYSYACIIIIPIAFYNSGIDIESNKFEDSVKACMWIWFAVAFLQKFYSKYFAQALLSSMRTDNMRGVTSLSNEPSFYGYMCFFFLLLSLDFKKNKVFYLVLNIVQLVFFAQSSVSLIYVGVLIVLLGMHEFVKFHVKDMLKVIALGIVFATILFVFASRFPSSRVAGLLRLFMQDPTRIVQLDESVSMRWNSIVQGFERFPYPNWLGGVTIMSGYGGIVYDFGLLAVLYIIYIYKLIQSGCSQKYKYVIPITLSICMFSAIQLSSPMFALYVGYNVKKGFSLRTSRNKRIYCFNG